MMNINAIKLGHLFNQYGVPFAHPLNPGKDEKLTPEFAVELVLANSQEDFERFYSLDPLVWAAAQKVVL